VRGAERSKLLEVMVKRPAGHTGEQRHWLVVMSKALVLFFILASCASALIQRADKEQQNQGADKEQQNQGASMYPWLDGIKEGEDKTDYSAVARQRQWEFGGSNTHDVKPYFEFRRRPSEQVSDLLGHEMYCYDGFPVTCTNAESNRYVYSANFTAMINSLELLEHEPPRNNTPRRRLGGGCSVYKRYLPMDVAKLSTADTCLRVKLTVDTTSHFLQWPSPGNMVITPVYQSNASEYCHIRPSQDWYYTQTKLGAQGQQFYQDPVAEIQVSNTAYGTGACSAQQGAYMVTISNGEFYFVSSTATKYTYADVTQFLFPQDSIAWFKVHSNKGELGCF